MKRARMLGLCSILALTGCSSKVKCGNIGQISKLESEVQEIQINNSDVILLARLLFGEARGESREHKIDVAYSVLNRTGQRKWWGNTLNEVILKPHQYSCFNKNDPNYKAVVYPLKFSAVAWNECVVVSRYVLSNPKQDTTNGATHYYSTWIPSPYWSNKKDPVKIIQNGDGIHKTKFYKLER